MLHPLFENYLNDVEKHLRPLAVSERLDIIKEIESTMLDMTQDGELPEAVVSRLGRPQDLARSYLGDLLEQDTRINRNQILRLIAFYTLTGFQGVVFLPMLFILALGFFIVGILTPIAGLLKLINQAFQLNISLINHMQFQIFEWSLDGWGAFALSLIVGLGLFYLGRISWWAFRTYYKKLARRVVNE